MACSDYDDPFMFLVDMSADHALDAVICTFTFSPLIEGVTLGMFVYGTLLAMYYISDDTLIVPLVLLVVLGAVIVPELPSGVVDVAVVVLMFAGAASVMFYIHRARATPT